MIVATSKAEAARTGARFFTSTPCPENHDSPRYARGGRCVDCTKAANAVRLGHAFRSGTVRGVVCAARDAAATAGETTYQGAPCKRGHRLRFTASSNCVECSTVATARDAELRSWRRREKLYGISREEFDALFDSQNGLCPICTDSLPAVDRIHVDHCHGTGRVRGLLCGRCNQGIGLLRESETIMRRAIAYVAG